MRKVFLCHSSKDKEYLRIVARHLGRAKVIFDEITFRAGQDFIEEINKNLEVSSLFVFVASKNSLNSVWCKYETDTAKIMKISDVLKNHLTIIIDRDVTFNDLPNWMQQTKAIIQTRPSQATRDIHNALYSILSPIFKKPFVGRQKLQEDFIDMISNLDYAQRS
ncbi:MAG: toll/interleukin-1 receptor domain-containing protein [Gammaproteobacteria bacterium]|nr:toll/interleukin-1 receptor domain-containing protein [Gammaproteobacteria bacterium]